MNRRPHLLTDEEVVRLLSECADRIRDCRGETSEGDAALRAAEWLTRAIDEKLIVYLHMRDLRSQEALQELLSLIDQSPR